MEKCMFKDMYNLMPHETLCMAGFSNFNTLKQIQHFLASTYLVHIFQAWIYFIISIVC